MQKELKYVLLVFFPLISALLAHACSCRPAHEFKTMRTAAESLFAGSMVLFEGRVKQIELQYGVPPSPDIVVPPEYPLPSALSVTFEATRAYKGSLKDVVAVITALGRGGDCGFEFEIGKSYLVDASADASGRLFTSRCHATREVDVAGAYLRVLRKEPAAPEDLLSPKEYWGKEYGEKENANPQGKLCGSITHRDRTPVTKSVTGSVWRVLNSPVAPVGYGNLDIHADGSFCSDTIPGGNYIVGAEDGEPSETGIQYTGYYPGTSRSNSIAVKPGETKSGVSIILERQTVYTVSGRVIALRGKIGQSEELRVAMLRSDNELADLDDTAIESDGTFQFNDVLPGRYWLIAFQYAEPGSMPKWIPSKIDIVVPKQTSGILLKITAR